MEPKSILSKEEYNYLKSIDNLNLANDQASEKNAKLERQLGKTEAELERHKMEHSEVKKEHALKTQKLNSDFQILKEKADKDTARLIEIERDLNAKNHKLNLDILALKEKSAKDETALKVLGDLPAKYAKLAETAKETERVLRADLWKMEESNRGLLKQVEQQKQYVEGAAQNITDLESKIEEIEELEQQVEELEKRFHTVMNINRGYKEAEKQLISAGSSKDQIIFEHREKLEGLKPVLEQAQKDSAVVDLLKKPEITQQDLFDAGGNVDEWNGNATLHGIKFKQSYLKDKWFAIGGIVDEQVV